MHSENLVCHRHKEGKTYLLYFGFETLHIYFLGKVAKFQEKNLLSFQTYAPKTTEGLKIPLPPPPRF